MSRVGFGIRTFRTKIYELEKFNITKEEAESFAVPYDGFDIWNQNKDLTSGKPQIEKRVKYFHIVFVPFFPIETQWTIRNKNGLYKINAICEQKVKAIYPKSYSPWYAFLLPTLCVTSFLIYGTTEFLSKKISRHNYSNKLITERQKLIEVLDSMPSPFYIVATKSFKSDNFMRVDSIMRDSLYVTNLVYETEDFEIDYDYHKSFSSDSLESTIISRDSIISLIPKTPDEASYRNKNWKLRRIISVKNLDKPNLDFDFHLGGITIKNLGKPLTLIDFENNSSEKNRWTVETNQHLKTNESIRTLYKPTNKTSDESNLTFIFSDNDNFYEFQVQGTYKATSSYTAFVDTNVEMKK